MNHNKVSSEEFISLIQKLLGEGIPKRDLIALGEVITTLNPADWKSVVENIFVKDMKPIYQTSKAKIVSLKEIKNHIKNEGATKSFIKKISTTSKEIFQGSIKNARVSIPEAKNRLSQFSSKIMTDYNHLKTNEDKGRYILKLSLYSSLFAMAFHQGTKQKMLPKSTLPLMLLGVVLVFVNRILEQAELKLADNPSALKLSQDLRSLLRTLNMGFSSGMTFNIMVDGITEQKIQINDIDGKSLGSLMPKSIIDNMIYTTLMGLFSNEDKT